MKHPLIYTILLCAFMASCDEKTDPTPEPEPNPAPTDTTASNATVLTKTVLTAGSDVTTMQYEYDAQKRLVRYANTSTEAGYVEDTSVLVRDGNGVIQKIIYRSDTTRKYNDPKLDSVVFNLTSAGGKYIDKISTYTLYKKFVFRDSSHYTYTGDRITKEENFYHDTVNGNIVYLQNSTIDFTYDAAGNLTKMNTIYYKVDGINNYEFNIIYTYEDKGVNLANFGNEAILLGMLQNHSGRALKTYVSAYPTTAYNQTLTYLYKYNKNYLPLSADITDAAHSNAKSTLVYTYQ